MASTFLKILVLATIFSCVSCQHLKVPASEFAVSLRSTIKIIRQLISKVSHFPTSIFGNFRLRNAISDCLLLMDLSVDQLTQTLSASLNPNGNDSVTGDVNADMLTWLSGALTNQDTCKEGFDGTNGIIKGLVGGVLDKISSSVYNILLNVKPITTTPPPSRGGSKLISSKKLPNWLKPFDQHLLRGVTNETVEHVVVAADGTGDFTRIMDAIEAAPDRSSERFIIHVKKGVYKEYVVINKDKWNIKMFGDGVNLTVITGNRNYVDGWPTYGSATFSVKGRGFFARDITFENTAGPEKEQAVAFLSDSDLSVLHRCAFLGYQDTLYAHSQRQFYSECYITGTVDFIFGYGAVVFQSCQIVARRPLDKQKNVITAHGRNKPLETTGFSIQFCNISTDANLVNSTTQTYLGRPWKLYSRTVIMQSYISSAIMPKGWLEWDGDFALDTLYYGEFMNYGPGAELWGRVKWPGYRVFNNSGEVANFTVARFITGDTWLPLTGVRYVAGLGM
ncbi:pectinesterase [Salvia divinorum]|uniref:Pectinesterase n=1 Tax=Salvia divinorum TaxID=28513 RepID=A0ABD1IDN2_SALDI